MTTTNPFADPATVTGIQWDTLLGRLLLIEPHAYETGINTVHGTKDAVRADVTVIDADGAPQVYTDALIFPGKLVGQLKSRIDQMVLGRFAQGVAKPGQNAPWQINNPSPQDIEIGVRYLDSRKPANPFAAPAQQGDRGVPF